MRGRSRSKTELRFLVLQETSWLVQITFGPGSPGFAAESGIRPVIYHGFKGAKCIFPHSRLCRREATAEAGMEEWETTRSPDVNVGPKTACGGEGP